MSRRFRTHYDNLKVSRDAPPEVIRSAYKALVNKYHPDRNHGSERALRAMQAINTSFEVLNDPVRRKAHDEWIDRKTGQTASNPYTAPRPAPQPEPFRPSPQPQREPTHTYTPPPNPTLEWQLGCFRWIIGLVVLGLIGSVLEMCSDRPRRSSYRPPTPTPTPVPTPPPVPARPVEPIKAPLGMQWGVTSERVKDFVKRAGARVVSESPEGYQSAVVVDGIKGAGLDRATFYFVDNSLREVAIDYGSSATTVAAAASQMDRLVADASEKYGNGYRYKAAETKSAGGTKKLEGWAWVQDGGSLRIALTTSISNQPTGATKLVDPQTKKEIGPDQLNAAQADYLSRLTNTEFGQVAALSGPASIPAFVADASSDSAEAASRSKWAIVYSSPEFPPHETVEFLTDQPGRAPFKVQTEAGSNFLLKLVDPQTRKDVMRMFIVGGREANFWVPVGEYELVYASGHNWYGDELLFGPETQYARADTVSRFASAVSSADAAKIPDLERRQAAAVKALRDYMVRNKFGKQTIDFIFEGRDPQENLKGPERLMTEWWQQNVLNKIGNKPKLYNGLVERLNAFNRAANNLLKLHSDAGGYNGVALTLYAVRGGNLETVPISAEDFFGNEGVATP